MRVLFAGTPEIAVPSLRDLLGSHDCVAVLTAPDKPAGRGRRLQPSAVGEFALQQGIPLLRFERLDADARAKVERLNAEILICFAYGKIFGPKFLSLFPRGGLNVHPSLLPRFRGPSPISAAILEGDSRTGVSVQALALEMDAGDIYGRREIPLTGTETTESLSSVAAEIGAELLLQVLSEIEEGKAFPQAQETEGISYCSLLSKNDALIDWTRPAVETERAVRAYQPWPVAFTHFQGDMLKVHEAAVAETDAEGSVPGSVLAVDTNQGILVQTGSGVLSLRRLQLPGRKVLDWKAFLNGTPDFIGSHLGGIPR